MAGLSTMAPVMAVAGHVLGLAGAAFLFWCAARTFMRRGAGLAAPGGASLSPRLAYGSDLALAASNPMSPMLMLALLSPVVKLSAPSPVQTTTLLAGMFAAAVTWWVCLAGGVSLLRSRLTPFMLAVVNQIAGVMLTIYGAVLLIRSAGM